MLTAKTDEETRPHLKKTLAKLKGHAIPLFGYHILRDHILTEITGEHQSSILYWAGKNLAAKLNISTYEECIDLFSEMGWGNLSLSQNRQNQKVFYLESPFFSTRQMEKNPSTFALECGFLAETVAKLEGQITQGEFSSAKKKENMYIQFTVHGQALDAP